MVADLIRPTERGLYCPPGDFYIDPWRPVERAVITHAHGDHARWGHRIYYASHASRPLLERRLSRDALILGCDFDKPFRLGDAWISFHPAGHILGSSQVRVEYRGCVWVASGDYKRDVDPTCEPFQVVPCDTFITEATFALPIYRWEPVARVAGEIHQWWRACARAGQTAVLFCYALGKAQRILAELLAYTRDTAYLHGAMVPLVDAYRDAGVAMLPTASVSAMPRNHDFAGALVLAPPSAAGSSWMRRFRPESTGFASGWMRIRGNRRRRGYDRGFVVSDHADWPALLQTVRDTGARRVLATHGRTDVLVRYLNEVEGVDAQPLVTDYGGEADD
ncbi:ligase-associated DNA damage response exonuclease [Aquisalimonas sp.]|uniref:ligase-associated DNA damage response exonuclease n=1 Tax=unclassified Aquisalimonas TaxID=2644645 RepID=UPI0025BCC78B|nr:ligase-associated DNA damage response exonuclease [Aquisalimonas sp.]